MRQIRWYVRRITSGWIINLTHLNLHPSHGCAHLIDAAGGGWISERAAYDHEDD